MGEISVELFDEEDKFWELVVEEEDGYLGSVLVTTEDMKAIIELFGEVLEEELKEE